MFSSIEKFYRKNNRYNKFIKLIVVFDTILFILYSIFTFNKIPFLIFLILGFILSFLVLFLIIYIVCRKEVKEEKKNNKQLRVIQAARKKIIINEKSLLKDFLIDNNWYDLQTIEMIISHYRMLIPPNPRMNSFLPILSIIISFLVAVVNGNKINEAFLSFLMTAIVIYIIIYFTYRQFIYIIRNLKGEESIYESLEEIFCEIYAELVANQKVDNLKDDDL